MYKDVQRYLELEKKVNSPHFLSRLQWIATLVIQPLGHLLFWICLVAFPNVLAYFGYAEQPSTLKMIMYVLSSFHTLYRCITSWIDVVEFYQLGTLFILAHIKYARSGFQYHIRSSTPSHTLYRYAAAAALSSTA